MTGHLWALAWGLAFTRVLLKVFGSSCKFFSSFGKSTKRAGVSRLHILLPIRLKCPWQNMSACAPTGWSTPRVTISIVLSAPRVSRDYACFSSRKQTRLSGFAPNSSHGGKIPNIFTPRLCFQFESREGDFDQTSLHFHLLQQSISSVRTYHSLNTRD